MAYTTINKSTDYFNTKLYTGNGSAGHSITGVGFQPDFVWAKQRGGASGHHLYDALRGVTKRIRSDTNGAETTASTGLTAFGTDGFTVGVDSGVNSNGGTMASWNWKANGAGSANTDGYTNSTVSVNTTAGFSIVKYTGTGCQTTVGHGLGVAPKVVLVKTRLFIDTFVGRLKERIWFIEYLVKEYIFKNLKPELVEKKDPPIITSKIYIKFKFAWSKSIEIPIFEILLTKDKKLIVKLLS